MDELITIEQARKMLRVSRMTIYRYFSSGRLTRHKEGYFVKVNRNEVELLREKLKSLKREIEKLLKAKQ